MMDDSPGKGFVETGFSAFRSLLSPVDSSEDQACHRWSRWGLSRVMWAAADADCGKCVAYGTDGEHGFRLVQTPDGLPKVPKGVSYTEQGAMSSDGALLAVAGSPPEDQSVHIVDLRSKTIVGCVELAYVDPVVDLQFSRDGSKLAIGTMNGTVRIFDVATRAETLVIGPTSNRQLGHVKRVYAVSFPNEPRTVLSGSRDFTASVWDASDGKEQLRLETGDQVKAVTFAAGERLIATGGARKGSGVTLWDSRTGGLVVRIPFPEGVNALSASDDGRWLLAGGNGLTALYDLRSGGERARVSLPPQVKSSRGVKLLRFLSQRRYTVVFENGQVYTAGLPS